MQAGDDGLFVMPDGLTQEAAASPARSAKQKRSRGTGATGGAAGAAEAGGGGAPAYLLGGFGEGEVALSLEGLPRHDLELM